MVTGEAGIISSNAFYMLKCNVAAYRPIQQQRQAMHILKLSIFTNI